MALQFIVDTIIRDLEFFLKNERKNRTLTILMMKKWKDGSWCLSFRKWQKNSKILLT